MNIRPLPLPERKTDKFLSGVMVDLAKMKIDLAISRYEVLLKKGEKWILPPKKKEKQFPS